MPTFMIFSDMMAKNGACVWKSDLNISIGFFIIFLCFFLSYSFAWEDIVNIWVNVSLRFKTQGALSKVFSGKAVKMF